MIEEDKIIGAAGNLNIKLSRRGSKIQQRIISIANSDAGLAKKLNPDRQETMQDEIDHLSKKQHDDVIIYATLRWVLGTTEEIDTDNLELEV